MKRFLPLTALAIFLHGCTAGPLEPTAIAAMDRYPTWPIDGCGYWTRTQGYMVFFKPNSIEPFSSSRVDEMLDAFALNWRTDGGIALVMAHLDRAEAAVPATDLNARRAAYIRMRLAERGVPFTRSWIRTLRDSEVLVPTAPGVAEAQNRRVVVINPLEGSRCRAERRRQRVEWFQRNCYPTRRTDQAACDRAIEDIRRGDVGSV